QLTKNTRVFRPTPDQIDSAAFKVVVGEAKYTQSGLPRGTIIDSAQGGLLEIKGGTSMLNTSYQLRLQTYQSLIEGVPFSIQTTRPVNSSFMQYLQRWGVTVQS